MKKIGLVVIAISLYSAVVFDTKADDEVKVAIVNIQKLEQNTAISKDLQNKVVKKEKEIQENLSKRKNKLDSDYKAIETKRAVLSQDELQKRVRKIQEDAQKLEMDGRITEQTFQMARMIVAQDIQEVMSKAVNKVADDKYDLVVPTAMALYVNPKKFDDITNKVADKMDDIQKTINFDKAYNQAKEQVNSMLKGKK